MLNIYNKDYQRIGFIESYSYLSWVRRYSQVGEFTLKCAPENLPLLSLGNILAKVGDDEGGIMETILVEAVEKETITVQGRFLTALLGKRIIWETEILNGDIGSCVGQLLNNQAINPLDPNRKIPMLGYKETVTGKTVQRQISFENLLEAVASLCGALGVGFKGILADGGVLVSLYQGRKQPFVFSREFENLLSQNYTDSQRDFANVAKIAGEGEGPARKIVVLGAGEGLERSEIYVDARDLALSEYDTEEDYCQALQARGRERLYERRRRASFDAVANTNSNLTYREDFDLGDIVTVKSSLLGISQRLRITEIVETYDENGLHIDLIFGDPLPTLGERLKGVI
jgi:hypothetical protein